MRKGIIALGVVLIIVGLILAIVLYPMVGYESAEETSDEISEFSFESISGESVKFKGTVDEVWTNEIPFASDVFELVGLLIFSVEGLEVETFIGGLFGSEETVPVLIFSDNMDVDDGDANSGDDNTCDTTYNWDDIGTTGCTYKCSPCYSWDGAGTCTIKTGENCTCINQALNDAACNEVRLQSDIINWIGTCIDNPANFNNKVFDCQRHAIDGDNSTGNNDFGIDLNGKSNNVIKNCEIRELVLFISCIIYYQNLLH